MRPSAPAKPSAPGPRAEPRPSAAAPTREKIRFIFNPISGRRGRNARLLPALRAFVAARSLDADLSVTEGPGHATQLAREALRSGFTRVVAVGGDGTVNEVAQVLRHTTATLALVPCGSGNGLARHLGLPASPLAALELVAAGGQVALVDTGTANLRPFFNVMGFGLDASVSQRFNRLTRRGLPAYVRAALAAFRGCKPEACRITTPEGRKALETMMVSIANSEQFGNGARVAPGARIDDGLLDLVAVEPVGLAGACLLGARLFLGTFDRSPRVRRWSGARFIVERAAPDIIHTDGEPCPAEATVEIKAHPRSLRVLVPAGSTAAEPAGPSGFILSW